MNAWGHDQEAWKAVRAIRDNLEFVWRMEGLKGLHEELQALKDPSAGITFEVEVFQETVGRYTAGLPFWEHAFSLMVNQVLPCDRCGEHRADIRLRPDTEGEPFELVCTVCHGEEKRQRWPDHREEAKARWQAIYR